MDSRGLLLSPLSPQAVLVGEETPTKASMQDGRSCSPLKRKALFCEDEPGARGAKSAKSGTAVDCHHVVCRRLAGTEDCSSGSSSQLVGSLRRASGSEQWERLASCSQQPEDSVGWRGSEQCEAEKLGACSTSGEHCCSGLSGCGCADSACGGSITLRPLALAAELPSDIQAQLEPTPLLDMLARDAQLAAAHAASSLPDGLLLLRCSSGLPWVRRLRWYGGERMPLLAAPALPQEVEVQHTGRLRVGEGPTAEEAMKVFDPLRPTIPELELPRPDPEEELLRQEVLGLLWEPKLLEPAAWADVDRWHNLGTEFYAARQKVTWRQARKGAQGSEQPPDNFVSSLLC